MDSYLNEGVHYTGLWLREKSVPKADGIYFQQVRILNEEGDVAGHLDCIGGFKAEIQVRSNQDFDNAQIAIRFSNQDGVVIFTTCNTDSHGRFVAIRKGVHTYQVAIPGNLIVPGTYTLQLASHIPARQLFDVIDNTIAFCVEETGSVSLVTNDQRLGVVNPILAWNPVYVFQES
jgi:hypothetical protein